MHVEIVELNLKSSIKMKTNSDLGDFECGTIVSFKQTGLSISETGDILGFYRQGFPDQRGKREKSVKEKISSEWQLSG